MGAPSSVSDRPVESDSSSSSQSKSKMAGGSKEARKTTASDDSFFSLIYTIVKKVTVVGAIYFVGYMGWSVAWLITPILLAVARDQWRQSSDLKRSIAKASAMSNEKDVILARIDDLPAWVYFPDVERCEWLNRVCYFTYELLTVIAITVELQRIHCLFAF